MGVANVLGGMLETVKGLNVVVVSLAVEFMFPFDFPVSFGLPLSFRCFPLLPLRQFALAID